MGQGFPTINDPSLIFGLSGMCFRCFEICVFPTREAICHRGSLVLLKPQKVDGYDLKWHPKKGKSQQFTITTLPETNIHFRVSLAGLSR